MDCEPVVEAISARLDGEVTDVAPDVVADHIASCPGCARFEQRAVETMRTMRIASELPVPDQTDAIVARIGGPADRGARRRRIDWVRGILVGLAVVELGSGLRLFADGGVHASRDAAAFGIALAIGLLVAAARPMLAVGILPIVAVLAATSLAGGVVDIAAGRVGAVAELHHVIELGAAAAMWFLLKPMVVGRALFRATPTV